MREALSLTSAILSAMNPHDGVDRESARLEALVAKDTPYAIEMTAPLNVGIDNLYATHGSHRSHSSHSSHSSHYSGSGGYRSAPSYPPPSTYTPPPVPRQTLAPSVYKSPASQPSRGGNSPDALQLLVMRVQLALYAAGYDPGAVDGVLTESTRQALRKFQAARGITVDGRMSTATLNALGVRLP